MNKIFEYTAKNNTGEVKKGTFSSDERMRVYENLKQDGYSVSSLKELDQNKQPIFEKCFNRFSWVTLEDKMLFVRHLAVMVDAGITLPRSLGILQNQARTTRLKNIIKDIADNVQRGKSLSESMESHNKVFGHLFINIVRSGEKSGSLNDTLNLLAKHLEKEHSLMAKIRGAMMYPAMVLFAMVVVGITMMIVVVPKLANMFMELGVTLPLSTTMLINISLWLKNNFVVAIILLIIMAIVLRCFLSRNFGKKIYHLIILKIPKVNIMVKKINSARFARITSSLIQAGIPLSEALRSTAKTLPNIYYKMSLEKTADEIQKGKNFHDALQEFDHLYPLLVTQMAEIGEETGTSGSILSKLADFYEEDIDNFTKNLSSIIEPALMVVIACAVGFLAFAMIQPMYSLMGAI